MPDYSPITAPYPAPCGWWLRSGGYTMVAPELTSSQPSNDPNLQKV